MRSTKRCRPWPRGRRCNSSGKLRKPVSDLLDPNTPRPRSSAARLRRLLAVHSSGAKGSPRVVGSTKAARSPSSVGSASMRAGRPAPFRRTRPGTASGSASPRSSASPRPIVLRAMPVIRETATTPPRPAASASAAANRRRPRSSSAGSSAAYRNLIAASSITRRFYNPASHRGNPLTDSSDLIIPPRALI